MSASDAATAARIAELEQALAMERARGDRLEAEHERLASERDRLASERDQLREAYELLKQQASWRIGGS